MSFSREAVDHLLYKALYTEDEIHRELKKFMKEKGEKKKKNKKIVLRIAI